MGGRGGGGDTNPLAGSFLGPEMAGPLSRAEIRAQDLHQLVGVQVHNLHADLNRPVDPKAASDGERKGKPGWLRRRVFAALWGVGLKGHQHQVYSGGPPAKIQVIKSSQALVVSSLRNGVQNLKLERSL